MKKLITLFACLGISMLVLAQSPAISVKVSGEGTPVIFLPGFACPGSVWEATVKQLDPGYQAHLVTYAGFDGVKPIPMPWYPALKEALVQYILHNKMQQVYVVGHSMGGNLATDLAIALPERVTKILLVDAIPCMRELMMPGVPAGAIVYDAPFNQQMLNMDENGMKQYVTMMAGNMTNDKVYADKLVEWMMMADRKTYVYGFVDLLKLDLRQDLSKIKADVGILGATFPDKAIVKENYEKQYANLARKEISYAEGSKHFIMFDVPDWFYAQTNAFLKK